MCDLIIDVKKNDKNQYPLRIKILTKVIIEANILNMAKDIRKIHKENPTDNKVVHGKKPNAFSL